MGNFTDILSFIVGTASTWSSPVIPKLQNDNVSEIPLGRQITENEASWIGSLSAMGSIFSPLIFGFVIQKVGRRTSGILAAVPFVIAYLTSAFAQVVELFYVARILMGIGVGGMFCTLPIYIVEVAEDVNRGLLSASTGTSMVAGMLFSYCVGPFVSIMVFNLILAVICVLYIPTFWLIAPETPYYLVKINKDEKALESLRYLRRKPDEDLQKELLQIKSYLNQMTQGSFSDLFKTKGTSKAFIYSITVTTFQQFSGINVIFSYTQTIFDATGSDLPSEINSIIVASVQFICSFIGPLLSDRLGRRILLLISITGGCLAEIVFGVYSFLEKRGDDMSSINWLPVVTLVIFIMFYNFGMGSLPWALMSELLPSNIISKASLVVTVIYWVVGFFLTQYFASLLNAIDMAVDLLATSGDITMTWTSPIFPKLKSNDSDVNPFDEPITSDEESWIGSLINIAPETPHYLIGKNKMNQAEKSLMTLRSHNKKVVETELQHIRSEFEKDETKGQFIDLFKSKVYLKGGPFGNFRRHNINMDFSNPPQTVFKRFQRESLESTNYIRRRILDWFINQHRFLAGISVGASCSLLPLYIAEIAEDSNRGMLSVTLNIFWTFGNLIPYVLGPYMPVLWFNFTVACVPAFFFVSFLIIAPESPYYLINTNKIDKAEESLMKLRSRSRSA
ncbi:Sugar tr and/or MFS 1 domain containing protein, partial [Asbolus verrucosus]